MQWRNMHLLLPPTSPLHQGCTARLTREGRQEGGAQTVLLFGRAGAAIALPSTSCAGEGHTPELPPAPLLSTCVCDGGHRETASSPPVPVVRTGCAGAPLQADSAGSAQPPAPAAWAESTGTGAEEQAAGSPASSRPQLGSRWGSDRGGQPGCAALGPLLWPWSPGRAGRRPWGERRASEELDSTGAGAELSWHHGAGIVVGIGVAAGQAGGQRGDGTVAGASVLQQDVDALLAAGSPGVGQRGQAPSVPALHIHPVLCRRESSQSVAPRCHVTHGHGGVGTARALAEAEGLCGTGVGREREMAGWAGQCQCACGGTHGRRMDEECPKRRCSGEAPG